MVIPTRYPTRSNTEIERLTENHLYACLCGVGRFEERGKLKQGQLDLHQMELDALNPPQKVATG